MAVQIPVNFRSGSGNITFNVDYFDYASGAGYKAYYPAGSYQGGAAAYFLTADTGVYSAYGYNYSGGNSDVDFDLTFNNPATIADAECIINFTVNINGADADAGNITWTVYHVSTGAVETSLGTATLAVSDGNPSNWKKHCVKFALTSKAFAVGEKLRINLVTATTAAGGIDGVYYDPAGRATAVDADGYTISTRCSIAIPFKIGL